MKNWENGRSEPKSPRLDAYQRLLNGWAAKYPAPGAAPAGQVAATAPRGLSDVTLNDIDYLDLDY
ncbi:hypothetical protein ASD48_40885 [Streptomyces sp. Root1310]|nr:hypothetical protein ASD48_40885 [Streptomyces sp. Root1310]